jgi:hypothetical protein
MDIIRAHREFIKDTIRMRFDFSTTPQARVRQR